MVVRRAYALVGLIVLLDALTKALTPDTVQQRHYTTTTWMIGTTLTVAVLVAVVAVVPMIRCAAAFALAGAVGNLTSCMLYGYVPNPFVAAYDGSWYTFNVADIALLMTLPALAVATAMLLTSRRAVT